MRALGAVASGRLILAALGLVGALAVVGCSGDGPEVTGPRAVPTRASLAPVIDADFPDPDVLSTAGGYYAYATQPKDGSANVQMARSSDLRDWRLLGADPLPRLPGWATTGRTWAPDVSAVDNGYVMYFTAHSAAPDLQCIGVARSAKPTGPFRPVGRHPLVCPANAGGAIDPASYVDPAGRRWLLWKNDGNCCGKDTWLHLQRVSADGLRLTGPARRLVKQGLPWEGDLVEAPTLVRHGSSYVLFYSANDYGGAKYATGYATARRLQGPYRKVTRPLLTSRRLGVIGPGGQDVVTDSTGRSHIVFHAWDDVIVYRGMYVADLDWHGDTPVPVIPGA